MYKDASGNVGIGVIPNTNFAFGAKLQLGPYQGIGATGFVNNLSYYSVGGVPNWRYPLGNATSTSLTGGLGCGGGYYLQFYAAAACSGVVDSVATGVFTPYAVDSSAQHIWKNLTTELMRIASSGNVGIGTSSPSKKLEVAGDILGTTVSASNGFVLNNKNVSASYTFPAGYNAVSVGAVTINSGVVVTVPSTQRWVVL